MEQVYLSSCKDYDFDGLKKIINLQFEALELDALVAPGCRALLKPNLIMKTNPNTAATTHPLVAAAVGCRLQELGAHVTIADSPGGPYTPVLLKSVYRACGYEAIAERYGFSLNLDCGYTEVEAPKGRRSRQFPVINPVLNADLVVDLPKLKTHCMTGMSGAVKNLFGTVPGLMKPELHCRFPEKDGFSEMLVDLCELIHPSIAVLDGIWAMEGDGPTGGSPRFMGAIAASKSPYALDVVSARLMNMEPMHIKMLENAMGRGLCPKGLEEIRILGESVEKLCVQDFRQPSSKTSNFIDRIPRPLRPVATRVATPVPKIREKDCVGCGKCAESCPQHTITLIPGHGGKKAKIDYSHCIRCYCCHEMCSARAVDIKRFSLFKW